jgi:UDP-2,3-diacylglucosamine pyrophosphatase LpxH
MNPRGKTLSHAERMAIAAQASQFPSNNAAALALNVHRETVRKAVEYAEAQRPKIRFSDIPADDIETEEELRLAARRFEKRLANAQARDWQPIRIETKEPIVLAFVGDPHIDDNGCNLPLLLEHVELLRQEHVYAVNIGDTTNNWTGRLMRLYANQDTSVSTARKRAKWLMQEAGIQWLVWVMGNHDEWENGADILRGMNTRGVVMEDWQARFSVEFPTGLEVPVWAAHDFKGHSQFNKLHAAMRTARERRGAAIYVCGHKHDWAVHHEEIPDTGETFWALRARGYKFLDSYSAKLGFASSRYGATVAAVIDPRETDNPLKAVTCFADLQQAINYRRAL